jgi:phospholipase C
MARDPALTRLRAVKHIVVLMMENRSFDHMLGYLALDGTLPVDGLKPTMSNEGPGGKVYPVRPFDPGQTVFTDPKDPLDESLDPGHDPPDVAEQMAGNMGGFVKNFVKLKKPVARWRDFPMRYFTGEHLPVYDHLARNYAVCDRWHSSVPGDTWPNRLYSLAGREADSVAKDIGLLDRVVHAPLWQQLKNVPIYDVAAFTRHLDDAQWRWYSHDPATLRAADGRYRDAALFDRDNFTYFNRKSLTVAQQVADFPIVTRDSFLDDAANAQLRDVSWIDPNFINLHIFDTSSNDDHPPSDVKAGQSLVLDLYHALVNSPDWNDTLLVITYDEHGGFFDHVQPPKVPKGDGGRFPTYGVRVPALVVGPRVRKGVCHELFDHTSLIKTILLRFAEKPEQAIAAMGQRTAQAQHLGVALQDRPRTDIDSHQELLDTIEQWRVEARAKRTALQAAPSPRTDGAGHPMRLHEFQQGFVAFAAFMRQHGLPPGQP